MEDMEEERKELRKSNRVRGHCLTLSECQNGTEATIDWGFEENIIAVGKLHAAMGNKANIIQL